jgi:hypothetical protein
MSDFVDRAKQIQAKLAQAADLLTTAVGLALHDVPKSEQFRPDIYMSLGKAAGHIRKARSLITREIDDAT